MAGSHTLLNIIMSNFNHKIISQKLINCISFPFVLSFAFLDRELRYHDRDSPSSILQPTSLASHLAVMTFMSSVLIRSYSFPLLGSGSKMSSKRKPHPFAFHPQFVHLCTMKIRTSLVQSRRHTLALPTQKSRIIAHAPLLKNHAMQTVVSPSS